MNHADTLREAFFTLVPMEGGPESMGSMLDAMFPRWHDILPMNNMRFDTVQCGVVTIHGGGVEWTYRLMKCGSMREEEEREAWQPIMSSTTGYPAIKLPDYLTSKKSTEVCITEKS